MSTATLNPTKCDGNCNYFGLCPIGLRECEIVFLNVHKANFSMSEEHKVSWLVGINLFSSWLHETEEQWEHNRKVLEGTREVEPELCEECSMMADELRKNSI